MNDSPSPFPPPVAWYDRLVTEHGVWEDCEGIPVAIGHFRSEPEFRAQVADALRLIAAQAPREFARLGRLMRGIVVVRLFGARGEWRRSLNTCLISTHFLESADASPSSIAATIIHELMHARLDALGFDYREERRARIERICYRRSRRFLENLPDSPERTAALEEVEAGLSLDSAEWSTAAFEDTRRNAPWYVRLLRFLFVRLPAILHRSPPT